MHAAECHNMYCYCFIGQPTSPTMGTGRHGSFYLDGEADDGDIGKLGEGDRRRGELRGEGCNEAADVGSGGTSFGEPRSPPTSCNELRELCLLN